MNQQNPSLMNTGTWFGYKNNVNQQNRNWWVLEKKNRKHTFTRQIGLGLGFRQWCHVIPRNFSWKMGFIWNKQLKQTSQTIYNIWKRKKKDFEENWTEQTSSDSLGWRWDWEWMSLG